MNPAPSQAAADFRTRREPVHGGSVAAVQAANGPATSGGLSQRSDVPHDGGIEAPRVLCSFRNIEAY